MIEGVVGFYFGIGVCLGIVYYMVGEERHGWARVMAAIQAFLVALVWLPILAIAVGPEVASGLYR